MVKTLPVFGRAAPYRKKELWPGAVWTEPPLPISRVPSSMNRRARESRDSNLEYFWCRSCNRLTKSSHEAFCTKHKTPRSKFMRRSNKATAQVVETELVAKFTDIARDIASLYLRIVSDPDQEQRASARKNLKARIAELGTLAKELESAPAHARADDLDDDDYLVI